MYHCFSKLLKKFQSLNYEIVIKDNINDIPIVDWNWKNSNLYLSHEFLKTYEIIFTPSLQFKYVLIYKNGFPVLKTCFQIKDFQAAELGDLLEKEIVDIRKKRYRLLAKLFNQYSEKNLVRVITCSNAIISGENAFQYDTALIPEKEIIPLLEAVVDEIENTCESIRRISCILIKDFYDQSLNAFKKDLKDLYCFQVEPEMRIDIPDNVLSLQDYIQLFSKKYRNRAKSILEHQSQFKIISIDKHNISEHLEKLNQLFTQVIDKADFNFINIPKDYFVILLKQHPEHFKLFAYFRENEMIAFRSSFKPNVFELEAHFIGLNYDLNKELELYQNILYGYIEEAITQNIKSLSLGRTASEIKTTVGAIPHALNCFIKPSNSISELIIQPYLKYLQPRPFQARHPFKVSTEIGSEI
jgi:hypothetical protein